MYVCEANTSFAFKAFQKENPFLVLLIIFILSCYSFGMAIRIFELYYWENFETDTQNYQNWNYQWNAMWFVFVSMTTVGYGDFSPKTQFGRAITIMTCLVGVYFVSIMMVFMTNKSLKSEGEEKAYKLITRLKYRDKNKHLYSEIIYLYLKNRLLVQNNANQEKLINEKAYNRRCIIRNVEKVKLNLKSIKRCELIPTKEQLIDISENLNNQIKIIFTELDNMSGKYNIIFRFN